ncbi:MAG: hypothetical protein WC700_02580 [Gemmatimonadaceae bacterium]|jgi:hypothetical protein
MSLLKTLCSLGLALTLASATSEAQQPIARNVHAQLQRAAGPYPLDSAYALGRDTVVLVLRDSTLTPATAAAGSWMFGPPPTKAEEDGCPPEKVLGRRLARIVWTELGTPADLQLVIVRVQGPLTGSPLGSMIQVTENLFYPRFQLTGPWVGDRPGAN